MLKNKSCVFCDKEKTKDSTLGETKDFFIKVGLGLTSPGHIMIISKNHYSCFAELPPKLYEEFLDLKGRVEKIIAEKFSGTFSIEYSPPFQSVPHAHVHLVPLESQKPKYKIHNVVKEMEVPDWIEVKEADIEEIRRVWKEEKSYISIEQNGKLYVAHTKNLKVNQVIPILGYRYFLKNKKGVNIPVSWQNMTEEQKIEDEEKRTVTINKLYSVFKKIS